MFRNVVTRTAAVVLLAFGLLAPEARAAAAITYVDFAYGGGTTRAAPGEVVRLYVTGGACRVESRDSPPTVNGGTIEFTLVFNTSCFATPPAFAWLRDMEGIPPGTYAVNYYQQYAPPDDSFPAGPKTLVSTRTLIVGPRPVLAPGTNPGALDPSFGTDGVSSMPFLGYFRPPTTIVQQRNGQVIVGAAGFGSYSVSRLLDSGAVDGTFATGGTINAASHQLTASRMAIDSNDETLLVGGKYFDELHLAIQRYSASGILKNEIDLSQTTLSKSAPVGMNPFALDIATLPDGSYIVAGISGNMYATASCAGRWFVARFTAADALDPAFGHGGIALGPSTGCLNRIVPTPDHGFLGLGTTSDAIEANFLVKLDGAGQIDTSFGVNGVVNGSFARSTPRLQADGNIVLGGPNFSLMSLRGNGSIDTTFGNQGVIANQTGINLRIEDFLLMADRSILLVGGLDLGIDDPAVPNALALQPVLTRYHAGGTLDRGFGSNGISSMNNIQVRSDRTDPNGPAEAMVLMALANGRAMLATPTGDRHSDNRSISLFRFQTDTAAPPPADANFQGLWWNAAESGWGLNLAHQGDAIFATWFTYDTSGNALWLSMLAGRTSPTGGFYVGDVVASVGPPFNNYTGAATATKVGTGMLSFTDAMNGFFSYSVTAGGAAGLAQTKAITQFVLDGSTPSPVCTYGAAPNPGNATNFQDLWWNPAEPGWGINFVHQGDLLFMTWYTYDAKGAGTAHPPLWLSGLLTRTGSGNVFAGPLNRTSGPRFDRYTPPYATQGVGFATVDFTNGNDATFDWVTDGSGGLPSMSSPQSNPITRFLFAAPAGTVCH